MSRNYVFATGEYYHVYNRGTEKREVYIDDVDYLRFVELLYYANRVEPTHMQQIRKDTSNQGFTSIDRGETLIEIGAWCLMPNHFHILVKEKVEGGISKFMSKLTTGYTMYFNKRRERTGALFQGAFKAQHVTYDNHLKYLFSYIHLNPVKLIQSDWKLNGITDHDKILKFLKKYVYSSFLDYTDTKRELSKILNKEVFPNYFPNNSHIEEVIEWLELDPERSLIKVSPRSKENKSYPQH